MPPVATKEEIALRREIGRRIHTMILAKGWNQSTLAREATKHFSGGEITRSNISNWVCGLVLPGPGRAQALAKALGVSIEEIRPSGTIEGLRRIPGPKGPRRQAQPQETININDAGNGKARVYIDRIVSWSVAMRVMKIFEDEGDHNGPNVGAGGGRTGGHASDVSTVAGRRPRKSVVSAAKRTG